MAKQVTLTFSNITNNGIPCKKPIIVLTGNNGNLAFPCSEKIDDKGQIKITIPDDEFVGSCISGYIKCDECDHCDEKEFTACLCETSSDCPSCSECIDGICVTMCKDGETCVDNTCVECTGDLDCPPGFYCNGKKCVCKGKINNNGECVECLSTTDCPPCSECINGNCTPIVCPNNLICIGGECDCPSGSKFDKITNSCVPTDNCTKDSDCDECETCIAGECTPIVCPKGYKCVGGECVEWGCTNTTCNNGADCGDNCGCLNGECVPCYILECNGQCEAALGCQCNGTVCSPVDNCGGYCDGTTPCTDKNCTCYNNECVNCANFPCNPNDCSDSVVS